MTSELEVSQISSRFIKPKEKYYLFEDIPMGAKLQQINGSYDQNLEERINALLAEKNKDVIKQVETKTIIPYNTSEPLLEVFPLDGQNMRSESGRCFIKNPNYIGADAPCPAPTL